MNIIQPRPGHKYFVVAPVPITMEETVKQILTTEFGIHIIGMISCPTGTAFQFIEVSDRKPTDAILQGSLKK